MAYNPPTNGQDPWGDNVLETLAYLKTTAEGAATTAGTATTTANSAQSTANAAAAKASNLSDLTNSGTARTNLGLGSAAVANTGDFDAAGAAATAQAAAVQRGNHTGTQSADTITDGTTNKAFLATERTKLSGIATSATANDTDANLKARANHTGTQLASTVSDFSTAADARVAAAVGVSVQAFDSDLTAFAAKTAPSGAVVGTTDTQTLTNKTLTAPAISSPTGLAKADVGLGSVDNTSDTTKNAASVTLTNKTISGSSNTLSNIAVSSLTGFLTQTSTASTSTPAPTGDALRNQYFVTAAAANMTVSAPSGTPVNGNSLLIRFKDNATARTIAWNAIFRAVGVTLPTTTTISKTLYVGAFYNSTDSKWDVTAVGLEA